MSDKTQQDSLLLQMRGVHIEGQSEDTWLPIIKGIDLTLHRGQVLGLSLIHI